MKTTKKTTNKKSTKLLTLLIILFYSLNLLAQTSQIDIPGDMDGASGLAGDIIAADGKLFVYTTKSVLVYNLAGNIITSISFLDDKKYSKFAPHYFWSEKYLADNQMMTYNSNNHLLYVLTPELNIEIINTAMAIPTAQNYSWQLDENVPVQTPMHGFAVLKFDNIRRRLFLIYNSRRADQNEYSFHSRSVYFSISSVSENGLIRNVDFSKVFEMNNGSDYNKTIFDVEFNDISDVNNEHYNEFYLARRYIIETCELLTDENGTYLNVIREYPDGIVYDENGKPNPICPNPGKFTKLLYIHDGNIHKVVAIPYKMPVLGHEPPDECNVEFPVIDIDDPANNQSIVSPHKRVIDIVYMGGNNDLILCFGDKDEFFNPAYNNDNVDRTENDMAIFNYDISTGRFVDNLDNDDNWINSNPALKGPDDFVKLNIPLRIVKNAADPTNSFFLCKANEIVRFDFSGGTYIPDESSRYHGEGCHFYRGTQVGNQTCILNTGKSAYEIFTGNAHTTSVQTGFQALRLCPDPINRKLYVYNDLNIHS
ncbi:MAG: hypothetical protein GXO88_08525, partial [Chlorobi bacterium]|nr:hypothetical protein [Chlorobiota bacterium]